MAPRVVITGIGLVTCLGTGSELVWKRLIAGESGITQLLDPAYSKLPSRLAGRVIKGDKEGDFNMEDMELKCNTKCASQASLYVLKAAHEAVSNAKLDLNDPQTQLNTGVAVGSSLVEAWRVREAGLRLDQGYNKLSPHFVPQILTNMTAGLVSIQFSAKGPNHSVATACATGLHSIGDAFRFIRNGDADAMICGSTEACIEPLIMAGLSRMRALSTSFNDRPLEASRPFDAKRDGFIISEGACVVVMEKLENAVKRGVEPIAEVLGYGLSSDAKHVTAPSPNGDGAYRSMQAALRDAGVDVSEVGYINAHATSTPLGDAAEAEAIYKLFHHNNDTNKTNNTNSTTNNSTTTSTTKLPLVSSTKGAIGHMLAGAGSTEASFTALACKHRTIPSTLNLALPSNIPFPLNFVSGGCREWRGGVEKCIAITNSFGFGGTNGSLCISEFIS